MRDEIQANYPEYPPVDTCSYLSVIEKCVFLQSRLPFMHIVSLLYNTQEICFILVSIVCVRVCMCACACPSKPKLHFPVLLHTNCLSNRVAVSTNSVRLADSLKQALAKTASGCTWHLFSSLYFIKGTRTLLHQCSHNSAKLVVCLPSAVVFAVELCSSPGRLFLQQAVYSHSIWKTW